MTSSQGDKSLFKSTLKSTAIVALRVVDHLTPFSHLNRLLSAPLAHSLSTLFFTFPVLVLGNSLTTSTSRGTMNLLIPLVGFAHPMTSSPLICFPSCTVMKAFGLSPQCESAMATTPASKMSGCVASMDSSATDEMFSPPMMIYQPSEHVLSKAGQSRTANDDVLCSVQDLNGAVWVPNR